MGALSQDWASFGTFWHVLSHTPVTVSKLQYGSLLHRLALLYV
jgi:hypothetical protein